MSGQMLMILGGVLLAGASAVMAVLEIYLKKKKREIEEQIYQIF